MGVLERFGNFEIARGADGRPVELVRTPEECVFLAFDARIKRLVELHVLKGGTRVLPSEKNAALERATMAATVRRKSFMRVLSRGEEDDVVYYSSSLNDGELLEDFITRRGALPAPTVFSLMLQLLDDLSSLQGTPLLLAEVRLGQLLMTMQEDTFLQLLVLDYGLSNQSGQLSSEQAMQRLVTEACAAIFLMLTGKTFAGDDCDRYPVLTGLPTGLRATLRSSLANPDNAPVSIERLRDEVRDALMAQTRDLQGRNSRRHLVATHNMIPKSALGEILLHEVPLSQLLKGHLLLDGGAEQGRYPFTYQAVDSRQDVPVTVHLLPPRRIVSSDHYDAVPLQMWRFNSAKHPNILRSRSVWESPDLTFLTEERGPGVPLSRLIAERGYLNPAEVLILIRQVKAGIDQALECGVEKLDLHPTNITLRLNAAPQGREMDKLLQKRLDAWPKFLVMLRPHMTMRSLYEPLLVDVPGGGKYDEAHESSEHRNRSFLALTAYLLSGERQLDGGFWMPDSLPPDLASYVEGCMRRSSQQGGSPAPQELVREFEQRAMIADSNGSEGGISLPPLRSSNVARPIQAFSEPMESAGSVSDFDEDSSDTVPYAPPLVTKSRPGSATSLLRVSSVGSTAPKKPQSKGAVGMVLWAAGFVVLVLIIISLFSSKGSGSSSESPTAATLPARVDAASDLAAKPASPSKTPSWRFEEKRRAIVPTEGEKSELRRLQLESESPPPQVAAP
jgi:hypothetical protein